MMNQEDEMNGNETQYASLTAGLLARKGEAVPAAAAFTAEAIAQHIPARRLAQEAERVLHDRRPEIDHVIEDTSVAWREADHESRGAQVVSEHRDMIERAFDESVRQDEGMPSLQRPLNEGGSIEEVLDQSTSSEPANGEMDLGERRELNLPYVGPPENAPVAALETPLETTPASVISDHLEDGSAVSDLNDSDDNWFETIVSNAISEAEGQRTDTRASGALAEPVAEPVAEPGLFDDVAVGEDAEGSLVSPTFAQGMAADRAEDRAEDQAEDSTGQETSNALPSAAPMPEKARAPVGGCGDKAAKVRAAIKTGKTNVAARSAMRLDPRRFIRLSLAAQKLELSSQEVMIAALDNYMDTLEDEVFSDCACMKKGLI